MKQYYNANTNEWYVEGTVITRIVGSGVFSGIPNVALLTSWGFEEWVEPTPTPVQQLKRAKAEKISSLLDYDNSDSVNSFSIGGRSMWLTREERTQIDESVSAYEAAGISQMTKYFDGLPYTFALTQWRDMLNALIVYASEALNVTEQHKANINALETIEAVEAYDYEQGYPQKLVFAIQ